MGEVVDAIVVDLVGRVVDEAVVRVVVVEMMVVVGADVVLEVVVKGRVGGRVLEERLVVHVDADNRTVCC